MSKAPEVVPPIEAEVVESANLPSLNKTQFDGILELAAQTERIGAALDKIRSFVLKRALPGDFVRFGDKIELCGPGAERIAAALGISFTNCGDKKESGTDANGEYYIWYYTADVSLGGRVIERIQGRCGSRDKFFGFKDGAWKSLADVREADIRTAARRCVIKEGTKLMLGLRGIPFDSAASLGLETSKIKTVEFGTGGASDKRIDAPPAGTAVQIAKVERVARTYKEDGKGHKKGDSFTVYKVTDSTGAKYDTFSESLGLLADVAMGKKAWVKIGWKAAKNPKFAPELISLDDAEAPKAGSEPEQDEPHA